MTISDDAVECAAKGIYRHLMPPPFPIWAELDDATRAKYRPIARFALEAAAPHMGCAKDSENGVAREVDVV